MPTDFFFDKLENLCSNPSLTKFNMVHLKMGGPLVFGDEPNFVNPSFVGEPFVQLGECFTKKTQQAANGCRKISGMIKLPQEQRNSFSSTSEPR